MDVWNEIERLLSGFENSEVHEHELRALVGRMPAILDEVPAELRERAEELGAEALYMVGELDRVVGWVGRSSGAGGALWLGHALFDLGRYEDALPNLRRAARELPLQDWARLKVDELVLCIKIQVEPSGVGVDDFEQFHVRQQRLGADAPIPAEIRRTLAKAHEVGTLPEDVLRRAQALFGRD